MCTCVCGAGAHTQTLWSADNVEPWLQCTSPAMYAYSLIGTCTLLEALSAAPIVLPLDVAHPCVHAACCPGPACLLVLPLLLHLLAIICPDPASASACCLVSAFLARSGIRPEGPPDARSQQQRLLPPTAAMSANAAAPTSTAPRVPLASA